MIRVALVLALIGTALSGLSGALSAVESAIETRQAQMERLE